MAKTPHQPVVGPGVKTGEALADLTVRTWTDFPTETHWSLIPHPHARPRRVTSELHFCEVCGRPHMVRPNVLARGQGRYCSDICKNFAKTTPLIERFWASVEKGEGDLACWLWKGTIHPDSEYGVITVVTSNGVPKQFLAHRLAYELEHGPLPDGQLALHTCDIRACVRNDGNHSHLFAGTQAVNMADATRKGHRARGDQSGARLHPETRPRGELHGMAQLTEAQVIQIHTLRGTKPAYLIAAEFHITTTHLYRIWRFKVWAHLRPRLNT